MLTTIFNGLCMAIADSVPGVSGGTVAFILGFYDRMIGALHDLLGADRRARRQAFLYLVRLGIGWGIGMCACILLLSGLFAKNIYFMSSLFLGLTAASVPFVVFSEKEWMRGRHKQLGFTALGIFAVVGLTLLRSGGGLMGNVDFLALEPLTCIYLLFSGMFAISAMLLPGISGSTILLISGVYVPAISAAKRLLCLDISVLPGLLALGVGVLLGVCASIHCIRAAMRKYRSQMLYLILGLMLGSLFAIIMGPTNLAEPMPALGLSTFNRLGFFLGIGVLLGLELLKNTVQKRSRA